MGSPSTAHMAFPRLETLWKRGTSHLGYHQAVPLWAKTFLYSITDMGGNILNRTERVYEDFIACTQLVPITFASSVKYQGNHRLEWHAHVSVSYFATVEP